MNIKLELSDEVARLIEYIPDEMKSDILNDLIKQGIYNKSSIRADEAQVRANTDDINKVIKMIESLADGTIKRTPASSSVTVVEESSTEIEKKEVQASPTVISLSGIDSDDFDDDLLDLLK